ncbi:GntR family transcriptional regulator [Erysipelothrix piscisicarius]|uniref:GntR family transcriptional regulator n=1 Tax=Erysipelothrix piscisicarius TaxID=2485784 RepID=UPI002F93F562
MTKPLYEKIKNDIQRDIMNGTLSVHSQLPTELELSTTYGVSRITSKRALNELEQDGLIYRVQGKGSFVAESNTKKTSEDVYDLLFMMPFPMLRILVITHPECSKLYRERLTAYRFNATI